MTNNKVELKDIPKEVLVEEVVKEIIKCSKEEKIRWSNYEKGVRNSCHSPINEKVIKTDEKKVYHQERVDI